MNCRQGLIMVFFLLAVPGIIIARSDPFFEKDPHVFYGGLVLGMNMCQVDGDAYGGYHKAGLNVGAVVYAQFSPKVGISMEMLYSQKGSRAVIQTTSPYVGDYLQKYYLDLNYVEIPLMFNFLTNKRLHGSLGASYSRLVKSKEDMITDQGFYIDQDKYYFNKNNIDGIAGISYQLYKSLFVSFRYQYSLTTIRPASRAIIGWGINEYNNLFALRFTYLIDKGDR